MDENRNALIEEAIHNAISIGERLIILISSEQDLLSVICTAEKETHKSLPIFKQGHQSIFARDQESGGCCVRLAYYYEGTTFEGIRHDDYASYQEEVAPGGMFQTYTIVSLEDMLNNIRSAWSSSDLWECQPDDIYALL